MKKRGLQAPPPAGTRVRFTGYFLKSTGQATGSEGSKWFTIVSDSGFPKPDLCASGRFVAVDEELDRVGYEDVASTRPDGKLMRLIAIGNLEIVGAPPKAADQADALGPIKLPLGGPQS